MSAEPRRNAISDAAIADLAEAIGNAVDARKRARRSLVWSLLILIVAGLFTLGSYTDAQQHAAQTGEGSYYVLWGAMLFGALKVFRAGRVLWP